MVSFKSLVISVATLAAIVVPMGNVAHADTNEPFRYQDGVNWVSNAPFHGPGRDVLFYTPGSMEICGTTFSGPVIVSVVANEAEMGIVAMGVNSTIYNDPIYVGGDSYPARAAGAVNVLRDKAAQLGISHQVAIILVRDAVGNTVCDLVSNNGGVSPPVAQTTSQPAVPATPISSCPSAGSLEAMPRLLAQDAALNTWFHPIYNQGAFNSSGGFNGQYSWMHTLRLNRSDGGRFRQFPGNDGRFVFRQDGYQAAFAFSVLTSSQYKAQFGDGQFSDSVNIRTIPGTVVNVTTASGQQIQQATSDGGDLMVLLPDSGCISIQVNVANGNPAFESEMWFGPDDQTQLQLNRLDARN